jgi:hypothetical protein
MSAESVSFESLTATRKQRFSEIILSNRTNDVCCAAIYELDTLDFASCGSFFTGYNLGDYSVLAVIQNEAATENGRRVELKKMLNNEL